MLVYLGGWTTWARYYLVYPTHPVPPGYAHHRVLHVTCMSPTSLGRVTAIP